MKDPAFQSSFVSEKQFVGIPEEKIQDYAIISVKVPEGVTVEGYGKTIKGPSAVTLRHQGGHGSNAQYHAC